VSEECVRARPQAYFGNDPAGRNAVKYVDSMIQVEPATTPHFVS
jgi:hypothetical protein